MEITTCTHEGIYLVDSEGNESCHDCGGLLERAKPPHPAGRYSKLTPEARASILEAIRAGVTPYIAAVAAGVSPKTWRTWMYRRDDEPYASFRNEVNAAEAHACSTALRMLKTADAKAWLRHAASLEGAWREPTKQVQVEVGGSGVPIQIAPAAAPAFDYSKLTAADLAQLEHLLGTARVDAPAPALLPEAVQAEVIEDAEFTE